MSDKGENLPSVKSEEFNESTPLLLGTDAEIETKSRSENGSFGQSGPTEIVETYGSLDQTYGSLDQTVMAPLDVDRDTFEFPEDQTLEAAVNISPNRRHAVGRLGQTVNEGLDSNSGQCNSVRRLCCGSYGGPMGFWFYLSNILSYPVFVVPLQVILLSIPVSYIVMSLIFFRKCPLNKDLPVMILTFGIAGVVGLVCRIAVILWNKISGSERLCSIPNALYYTLNILTVLALAVEFYEVYRMSPSVDAKGKDFCDPTFYNFAYWMNWTSILIAVLYFILQIPNKMRHFNMLGCLVLTSFKF